MTATSTSVTIEKISEVAASFENRDLLLCFSQKNKFQSPLILGNGDVFFETWQDEAKPRPLASFFPTSAKYDEEKQNADLAKFRKILKTKAEDFCNQDLYMAAGFIKWGERSLAPAILIPLEYDIEHDTIAISTHAPVENIALPTLDASIHYPVAADYFKNGHFDCKKFFDTLDKKISHKTEWKFTRNGCCITFYSTNRLLLKKNLSGENWVSAKAANNDFFSATIGNGGFFPQQSLFENTAYDHVFSPAKHYFPYVTDSQTNKAAIDALNEDVSAYAIQTLPGSDKAKVAVNIVADLIAQKKKVCVISRRAITKLNFENAWKPPFRTFPKADRDDLQKKLNESRESIVTYYDSVNFPLKPCGATLSELFDEIAKLKHVKTKFPNDLFKNVEQVRYSKFRLMHSSLKQIANLFFREDGIKIYNAFQGIKLPAISNDRKNMIGEDLQQAKKQIEKIKPLVENVKKSNLYPEGIKLSDILELIETFKKNFDKDLPGYESWDLHSNGWIAYQDDLTDLPNSGERWSSYRRKGSDLFTDEAIEADVVEARDEFISSLGATLKGLSDRYRRPKRLLLSMFKNPKSLSTDAMIVEKINELIDLQEHKRKYKDSSVLATRLFGKDWKFEKTDWKDLANKIQHYYAFRSRHKNSEQFDHFVHLLEQWHLFKPFAEKFDEFKSSIETLESSLETISKSLNMGYSISAQNMDTWTDKIAFWAKYWDKQDVYLELCEQMDYVIDSPCENLAKFIQNTQNANGELASAFARAWTNSQMQIAASTSPDLFTLSAKARKQKSSQYRALLDQFSNANFYVIHELVEKKPALLQSISLSNSYNLEPASFDVALFLDADCTSIAEAMPGIIDAKKVILFGNPCSPALESHAADACNEIVSSQSIFFKDSVLSAVLRKGIPTTVIGFTTQYADPSLFNFANKRIYDNDIAQFPNSTVLKDKPQTLKVVYNKILSIAESAVQHAVKNPSQTLGIVTFSQSHCNLIEAEIQSLLEKYPASTKFFTQGNLQNKFYVKTVERAVDLYRDVLFVCPDIDEVTSDAANRKLSICTTLAKQKLVLFMDGDDTYKLSNSKPGLYQEWVNELQSKAPIQADEGFVDSVLDEQIKEVFESESIPFKNGVSQGGISIGPVVVDANNDKRFIAVIESDCGYEPYRESVEDREYIRPNTLSRFGWKIIYMWLPLWNIANSDERGNLITTIAIEQSVAPPPEEEIPLDEIEEQYTAPAVEPYAVTHPASDDANNQPIGEFPTDKLIEQLKFYVDHESPIHGELLMQRIMDLHHVEASLKINALLSNTIKQALHQKQFIKTGPFFYSLTNKEVVLRDRSKRPDCERKMIYVSPEERALLKTEHNIKQTLGLL